MDGAFGTPTRRRSPIINITPLIDVMFLLLIFFMVSSTFREQLGLNVNLPTSAEAVTQNYSENELTVTDKGYAYGEQTEISEAVMESILRRILADDPDARIVLRADELTPYRYYTDALGLMKRVGVKTLVLQTEGSSAEEIR